MAERVAAGVLLIPASRMAVFTARCIRDSSTCQRPFWLVNSFFRRFFCGKCYCHLSSLLPEGYFESRALGRLTASNPSSKSFWWIFLTSSICFQVFRDRLYVFDSGRSSWNLFLNCDSGFAFYFERELYFFLTRKTVFSKKTALSCIFLELVLTTWGLICVRFLFT